MDEARLEDSGAVTEEWFVGRRARRPLADDGGRREADVRLRVHLRNLLREFPQLGFRPHVLEPNGLYHAESEQEDFLVLAGECRLLVEGGERILRAWDFLHSSAGAEHAWSARTKSRACS